jgi:hypothetical protein
MEPEKITKEEENNLILMLEERGFVVVKEEYKLATTYGILEDEDQDEDEDYLKDQGPSIYAYKDIVTNAGFTAKISLCIFLWHKDKSATSIDMIKERGQVLGFNIEIKGKEDIAFIEAVTNLFSLFLKDKDSEMIMTYTDNEFYARKQKDNIKTYINLSSKERVLLCTNSPKNKKNLKITKISFDRIINEDLLVIYNEIKANKS